MIEYGIVVHGGAGSPEEYSDGCEKACASGFHMLESGKTALDAVVEAVRTLENDKRFNAGSGSALRIDGKTIEMDAAVMDSGAKLGIVINVRGVKNPVLLARAVLDTPHVALAGRGAEEYAREIGFRPFYRVSRESLDRYNKINAAIKDSKAKFSPYWKKFFPDTVGAVALDREGNFAVAASTGGASPMLVGRVGDTPMVGCGFYAGEGGAVALTGLGEEIIRRMSARAIYDMLAAGEGAKSACRKGLKLFPRALRTGAIAITRKGYAAVSSAGMAYHALIKEADK